MSSTARILYLGVALTILSWYSLVSFGQSLKNEVPPNATEQLDVSSAFPLPIPADLFCIHRSPVVGGAGTFKTGSSEIYDARARQSGPSASFD
jgi:hypothetical protein